MEVWMRPACLALGYLIGSFLTAEPVSRLLSGKSPKEYGSHNPGMTNVMLHLGKRAGFLVLAGDVLKTLLALFLCTALAREAIGTTAAILWGGMGTVLGHNFSFLAYFHGGKGVAVTCAWLMVLMPLWGTLSCVAGGIFCLATGYLPPGAVLIPVLAILPGFFTKGTEAGIFMLLASVMMFLRHHRGLKRVLRGGEHRFFRGKPRE